MSAYLESMAYRAGSATPWHGEGAQVSADASLEQWLRDAGLDWQVVSRPISVDGADQSVANYRAIMRPSDGTVYQIATTRYEPTQNHEILGFFRDFTDAGEMTIETVGSLRQGATVWALASIGESFQLAGSDRVKGYVLLANSHDGSMALSATTTSVRVVCWNTLSAAIGSRGQKAQFRMRHTRRFGAAEQREARQLLKIARAEFGRLHETADQLSQAPVTAPELVEWCYKLTDQNDSRKLLQAAAPAAAGPAAADLPADGSGLLDAILANHAGGRRNTPRGVEYRDLNAAGRAILKAAMRSPGSTLDSARGTWWGAVNGVTYYADHEIKTRGAGSRLDSAWFGTGSRLKARAVDLAMQATAGGAARA